MDASRIQAEIFETHYNKLAHNIKAKDYKSARYNMIVATKTLYEMALSCEGALRNQRIKQANRLYNQIPKLNSLIEEETKKREKKANSSCTPEQHLMNNGTQNRSDNDDDGKVFQALPVPDVSFNDVLGLEDVKESVRKKIIEPRLNPELYERYKMKPGGGILMYGPPGTGKTMVAKAIAHEVNAKFFSLKCSELTSKYFGGTEQNIGKLFDTARREKNAVIFFDEFEALAIGRDKNNSTVMRRVVSELLTQLQGVNDNNNKDGACLLVLAATNIPWMIDSAFLRPGRFDERIYVGLPDEESRRGILKMNLAGVPTKGSIDYDALVEATNGFNSSDMVQLVSKAKESAIDRENSNDLEKGICMEDFDFALQKVHSSVITSDLEKILAWKAKNG